MSMKIAVFATCWNEEGIRYYLEGFEKWAKDNHSIVDVYTCYGTIDLDDVFNWGEYRIYDLPDLSDYDGAIIVGSTINEPKVRTHLYEMVKKQGIPCVTIDHQVEGFSSIGIDQKQNMHDLTEHLIVEHKVTDFCYLGAPAGSVEADARLSGFLSALEEYHVAINPERILRKNYAYQDGIETVNSFTKENMPRGFVCANDDMASGVCDALIALKYEIGQDVFVTGFDNYFLGENYSPRLTTAGRPRGPIAYRSCEMIKNQVKHCAQIQNVYEKGKIILGETCGCNEESCGSGREFRKVVFHREHNKQYINALLEDMEEKIMSGESIEVVVANVGKMLNQVGISRCRIMLTPDLEAGFDGAIQDYRECTSACVHIAENVKNADQIEGFVYVYAPIHFHNHLYGYFVFRDVEKIMVDRQLSQFMKTIGMSIEKFVEQMKIKRLNKRLESLFETDSLTGAYNRYGMERVAAPLFDTCQAAGNAIDIVFVDIDHLKYINDTFGHEEGDYTIQLVGKALLKHQNDHCLVIRYGGDEFVVVKAGEGTFESFEKSVKKEIQELQSQNEKLYQISASIGCVRTKPEDHISLHDYIACADKQMYAIKKARKS